MTTARPDLERYRAEAIDWIKATIPGFLATVSHSAPADAARQLQRILFDAGYAGFAVAREYGGAGLTRAHEAVFEEELNRYRSPIFERLGVSLNIVGETIAAYGSDEQKQTYLPKILSGELVFVQLLSEPSGGSDLAALRTRADLDGGRFVLNGQKIWSTGAQDADLALAPARTNWDVPKHNGITMFVVDIHAPGVEVRPIRQIDGDAEFCEVFLTDVEASLAAVLGTVDDGWRVVRGLLGIEHEWAGRRRSGRRAAGDVSGLVALARARGLDRDPVAIDRIVALSVQARVHQALTARVGSLITRGLAPAGYGGLLKLSSDALLQRRAEAGLELAGLDGIAWDRDHDGADRWAYQFLNSRSASIAGGSDEIQRNNVAERVLGLPREASGSGGVPFREERHN